MISFLYELRLGDRGGLPKGHFRFDFNGFARVAWTANPDGETIQVSDLLVILSAVRCARSEHPAESKDPYSIPAVDGC